MKLYLADTVFHHYRKTVGLSDKPVRLLGSFYYFEKTDMDMEFQRSFPIYPDFMADSGIYSAYVKQITLDVAAYADWLHQWKHLFTTLVNLDDKIDYKRGLSNLKYLEGRGGSVYFGVTHGEIPPHGGDKSQRFLMLVREMLREYFDVTLYTLENHTKIEWVLYWMTHHPPDMLLDTYSCFTGGTPPCGTCQACLRHYIALVGGGIPRDRVTALYQNDPMQAATAALEKYREVLAGELTQPTSTYYGQRRASQDLWVLDKQGKFLASICKGEMYHD